MVRELTKKEKYEMREASRIGEKIANKLLAQNVSGYSLRLFDYKINFFLKGNKRDEYIPFISQYFSMWQEPIPDFVINHDWELVKTYTYAFLIGLSNYRRNPKYESLS